MMRTLAAAVMLLFLSAADAQAHIFCTISARDVAFGKVSGSERTFGGIVIACSGHGEDHYEITLTTGSSGSYDPRSMSDGRDTLSYNLYSDPFLARIWGDGSRGTVVVRGEIDLDHHDFVVIAVPMFARLPAQSESEPGDYSDTIIARMTYDGPTATTSFQVTGRVPPSCAMSATNLNFRSYQQAQLDGRSAISVTCSNATPWTIGLDEGRSFGATVNRRRMTGPGLFSSLSYDLYKDAARTQIWGNRGADTVSGTGTGNPQTVNVYGRIPGSQNADPGAYSDTITATLTF